MAVREIYCLPNAVLKRKARRVPAIDAPVRSLIRDMVETMQQANGVGLAAPQVGVSLRVVVIQLPEEAPIALVNPEIVRRSGEREVTEGCLSIPGYAGEIKRSVSVTVRGLDEAGKPVRIKGTELLAQALEHELDHLNGILFIDHVESPEKLHRVTEAKPEARSEASPEACRA